MACSYWWWTPDLISSLLEYHFLFKQALLCRLLHTSAIYMYSYYMLYMLVRYVSPSGPMYLRCMMSALSAPLKLLFLLCILFLLCLELCTSWTCVVVGVIWLSVVCVFPLYVSVCVVCFAFAICVAETIVFSLKVIVLFLGCVFCWLVHVLSSKEYVCCVSELSVCLSVLWRTGCSLHMSGVCVCMRHCTRDNMHRVHWCPILCLMCSGSNWHIECILPFGM